MKGLRTCLIISALGLAATTPARAWDVSVGVNFGDILDWSTHSGGGPFPVLQVTQRGVRAATGTIGIPINWTFQQWDGTEWSEPAGVDFDGSCYTFSDSAGLLAPDGDAEAQAITYYDDPMDEFSNGSEAYVYGGVNPGNAIGAAFAYDYTFTVESGIATLGLFGPEDAYGEVIKELGDTGIGFASLVLYDPSVGIDDPNGANNPYASVFASQDVEEGSSMLDVDAFEATLSGVEFGPGVYSLRLEGEVSVFSSSVVPVPAAAWLFGSALFGVGVVSRRTRKAA